MTPAGEHSTHAETSQKRSLSLSAPIYIECTTTDRFPFVCPTPALTKCRKKVDLLRRLQNRYITAPARTEAQAPQPPQPHRSRAATAATLQPAAGTETGTETGITGITAQHRYPKPKPNRNTNHKPKPNPNTNPKPKPNPNTNPIPKTNPNTNRKPKPNPNTKHKPKPNPNTNRKQ
jgi:hypothetical protein